MRSSNSDGRAPDEVPRLARGFGYLIGSVIGIAMLIIVLFVCLWAIRETGSALFGWDLFA